MRHAMSFIVWLGVLPFGAHADDDSTKGEKRYLYVVTPGVRNYLDYGGAGVLVFDIDRDHAFVKRIATSASAASKPENIKGVVACAATNRLYFTTLSKLYCVDLLSEMTLWEKALEGGCDRPALTPDGRFLYVPSLEGPHWHVVDVTTGDVIRKIVRNSGAHNTVCDVRGRRVYLAGLKSPLLGVVDPTTHDVVGEVGPFAAPIRPFTVNAAGTLCFVNINGLIGFEVGDIRSGKKLHRVEVPGVKQGPVKRHGCPSHGVGLTPDEKEIWVVDAHNQKVHVYENTLPPRYLESIALSDEPGWVTFTLDGRFAYPSTGEVIDTKTRKIVVSLKDEQGRRVQSEKMVQIDFANGKPIRNGDQFGIGRRLTD
jgi:hypothetical protein